jgi:biofilm protein TabA
MIVDHLQHWQHYAAIGGTLTAGLQFLANTDLAALPLGRIQIDGDKLFALVVEYETRGREQGVWEAHQIYHDIQCKTAGPYT